MRLGSLAILIALILFALVVPRLRRLDVFIPVSLQIDLQIREGVATEPRSLTLVVQSGRPRIIGRSAEADVVISDPEVSRRHAQLQAVRRTLFLTDLGSHNGTFLNGRRLPADGIEVRVGDYIDVGTTRIILAASERSA